MDKTIQEEPQAIRFLSLFSGIEAASVAWCPLGWECVGVAEIEKFPSAVLNHHYPTVPNLGDITKITREQVEALGHIDVVVFGFPCQDLSVAGKRAGLSDATGKVTRSGLFFTAMQIVRWSGARWTLAENVPGLLSSKSGADFAAVVGEMAGAEVDIPKGKWQNSGFLLGRDGLVQWAILDAQYFGVAQRRRRVFLVRDIGDWASTSPILLEPESLLGNPAPSREKRQEVASDATEGPASSDRHIGTPSHQVAPTIPSRNLGGGGLGSDFDCDGELVLHHNPDVSVNDKVWPAEVAAALDTTLGDKQGLDDQHINGGGQWFVSSMLVGREPSESDS